MFSWFNELPVLEQIFFYIALPATIILIIQTIMLFIAGGDGGAPDSGLDSDVSGMESGGGADSFDVPDGTDDAGTDVFDTGGLRFITVRGIIAFLTVSGWTGILCIEFGIKSVFAVFISIIAGTAALVGIAYLVRALLSLQESGNIDYRTALGQLGNVYIPIPGEGEGMGKVTLTLNERYSEFDAITNGSRAIGTGELVRVVDIVRGNVMVVEPDSDDRRKNN